MDPVTSSNNLKAIISEGIQSINNFMLETVRLESESKLNQIFEGALLLSNNIPQEKKMKFKILRYITNRRNNMYWLYLNHNLNKQNSTILTYDQYLRQLVNQQLQKSKPKSIICKVAQFFSSNPPQLNYSNYDPSQKEMTKTKEKFYKSNLPSSTKAKIEAWINFSLQQQLQHFMNESSTSKTTKIDHLIQNKHEDVFTQTAENSLHLD